ncbi:YdbH domain-containing protein [Desulfococcaceae bacterium HSG7]|nr:YdbH domain-containing protein [Desulfococcaceae bacterium HSG7]
MISKVPKRLWRGFIRRAALLLAGVLLVLGVATCLSFFNFYLPMYLETDLLPSLSRRVGISSFSCDVRSIGLNHADISELRIGSTVQDAVQIDSVRLDYSIKGLYERHIKRIIISNLEFQLRYRDGQWQIEGLNWEKIFQSLPKKERTVSSSESEHAPVTIGKIDIRNAILVVTRQAQNFRLPFDIEITPQNDSSFLRRADSIIHLYPDGQKLVCNVAVDFVHNACTLSLDTNNLQLAKFKDYLPLPDDMLLRSLTEIHAKVSLALAPLNFTDIQADLYLRDFKAGYKQTMLENLHASSQILKKASKKEPTLRPPVHIRLTGKSTQNWEFAVMNLTVSNPVHLDIETFSGILETKTDQIQATGNYTMTVAPSDEPASKLSVVQPLKIKGHYQAKVKPDGAWDLIASASSRKAQIKYNGLTFTSPSQSIEITGQSVSEFGIQNSEPPISNIRLEANISDWQVLANDKTFSGKAITLKGWTNFDNPSNSMPQVKFALETPVSGLMNKSIRFEIPTFITTGQASMDKQGKINFNGQIELKNARINDSGTNTAINGINVKLPLQWPYSQKSAKGTLTIKKLQWQKKSLGSIKATLNQTLNHKKTGGGIFTGTYFSTIAPNLRASLSGKLNLSSLTDYQVETKFRISRYKIDTKKAGADFDITRFLPQAEGLTFSGELSMNAGLKILPNGIKGKLQSEINAARIELKETGLILEGVDVRMNIPDLPKLRSAPGQVFSFKKGALGKLKFNNGKVKFQIESAQSFLIETGEFAWCNGRVDTPAIRIKAGVKDYSGILYCDRLNFSMLLNQLGDVTANGQGTVNGRLPVRFVNNKISFQDGFLYSTPGQEGTIQITSSSFGQTGIPGNAQNAQIELAKEALKDYTYKWVRLNLTTQGELLKARLQTDGKPVNPLPFIYDKKLGAFTRIEAGAGSRFQGIRLDVNFSLPLNKILHYGTKLQ